MVQFWAKFWGGGGGRRGGVRKNDGTSQSDQANKFCSF